MKTIKTTVKGVTITRKVFTPAELKKMSPSDRKFIKQMSSLADDMIKTRILERKPVKRAGTAR